MNEALSAIQPLVTAFAELGVLYRVGGSLASSIHGTMRTTLDADLAVNLRVSQVPKLVKALQGQYYVDEELILEALRQGRSFNLIHLETFIKIDCFPLLNRQYDQVAFSRVTVARATNFITAEDTILRKLEWYRLSDGSERQWRDIIGVLQVQKNQLDNAYLTHWATELGVLNLLEQAHSEASKEIQ